MVRVAAVLLVAAFAAGCSTQSAELSATSSNGAAAPQGQAKASPNARTAAAEPDCNPSPIVFLAFGLTGYMVAHAAKAASDPRCELRDSEAQAKLSADRDVH